MSACRAETLGSAGIFATARSAFAEIAHAQPDLVREIRCTLIGLPARIRIAGLELAETMAAPLTHLLRNDEAAPELEIELWDVAATGIAGPVASIAGVFENEWEIGDETLATAGPLLAHQLQGVVLCLHRGERRIVGWIPSHTRLSLHQRGKPLQTILSVWAHDRGAQPVHAGCVARDGAGVLLPGKGGSGKSTAALAGALGGFDFLADDLVLFDSSFDLHSFYCSAWLEAEHAHHFPALPILPTHGRRPIEIKALMMPGVVPGVQTASTARLCALALPRIVNRPASRPRRATRAEALFVLAPSTVLQLHPRSGRRELERLAELTERAPAFWLELGTDLRKVPEHIDEVLTAAAEIRVRH